MKQCFEDARVPKVLGAKASWWPTLEDTQETIGESVVTQVIYGQKFMKNIYVTLVAAGKGVHVFSKSALGFKKIGKGHEFFPYETITGVTTSFHLTYRHRLEFSRAANVDKYGGFQDENEAAQFVGAVRERINQARATSAPQSLSEAASDPLDQLKKLKELLEAGIISQEEFEEKKQVLMGRI